MFAEVDVLGAFVPAIALWLFAALTIFIVLDFLLAKAGFYRLFWHTALARVSLFVCWFCAVGLATTSL
jgi:protein AaeX